MPASSLVNLVSVDSAVLLSLATLSISLAIGLVKVIEVLVKRVLPKKKILSEEEFEKIKGIDFKIKTAQDLIRKSPTLSEEEHLMLQELHSWHDKTDGDGIPLWYLPRSFIDTQKEIVGVLLEISSHHEKSTYVLESLLKKIEKIEDKLDRNE